jgi:hypothetical protein
MKSDKRDARISLRLPSFLLDDIKLKNNLPRCKTANDKYVFLMETGLNAIKEFEKITTDPDYKQKAHDNLHAMFADGLVIENLMDMEAGKFKGLAMAVDLVRGQRKI